MNGNKVHCIFQVEILGVVFGWGYVSTYLHAVCTCTASGATRGYGIGGGVFHNPLSSAALLMLVEAS